MITSENVSELQKEILAIDTFLKNSFMNRITSSETFEIMRDCPELLDAIRNLQSFGILVGPKNKGNLDQVISSLEVEINKLLECFRSAIESRSKEPVTFDESAELEKINRQHQLLCEAYESNVALLLTGLQKDESVPGVRLGLGGPSVDIVEWWKWVRTRK